MKKKKKLKFKFKFNLKKLAMGTNSGEKRLNSELFMVADGRERSQLKR